MLPTSSSVCVLSALTYEAIKKKPSKGRTRAEALVSSHQTVNGGQPLTLKPIVLFPCKLRLVSITGLVLPHFGNSHSVRTLYVNSCNMVTNSFWTYNRQIWHWILVAVVLSRNEWAKNILFNIVVHMITINSILNRAHILDSLTDHLSPTNAEAVMGIEEYIRAVCPSQRQTQPLKAKPLKVYLKYILHVFALWQQLFSNSSEHALGLQANWCWVWHSCHEEHIHTGKGCYY